MTEVMVRELTSADWPMVEAIFVQGIATGHTTFESAPPTWEGFDSGKVAHSRLVALDAAGTVLGWAAASPVSSRAVYAGVVEHSVYVASAARGLGVGRMLLESFIASADANDLWTIQSSVFPENTASMRLHAEHGFRAVGRRERIAL